ncbi:MAG TPA: D-glycerate dehydrogenase [Anaerolineales bacterium]|nr:D-glycerate dehydrogenase [Anaerolineales bacterium]
MKPKVFVTRHLPQAAMEELEEACQVEIWDYDRPPPYGLIQEKLSDKEGLLSLLTDHIDAALMNAAPKLKVISQCAVGYDNIDIQAATKRGIAVGHTPGVLTDATADFAFTLLMASARRVGEAIDYVRSGKWETWGLTLLLGQDVHAATLGLIGLGRIGQAVAKRARGFSMRVLYYDLVRQPEVEAELDLEYCELDDLLRTADFVSLHVNLTGQTRGMMGSRAFSLMKPSAVLINTSRGAVIDSQALYEALSTGQIGYAALDVTDPEPLPSDHPLLALPNLIVAPHIASATVSSRTRMALMAVRNLVAGVQGEPLPFPVQTT